MNHSRHPICQTSGLPRLVCPHRIPSRFAVAALFLILILFTPAVLALAAGTNLLEDDPAQPWNIDADKITRDQKTGNLVAFGNVIITKQGKRLSADRIVFNQKTGDIRAEGNVMIITGKDVLTGSSVTLNLNTKKGVIDQGTLFIDSNHFYIKGDRIIKTGNDSYTVENPSITSCDGDKPDWKITGKKLDVTIEGYGYVTSAALWAKSVPVLYSPFLAFPAKIKRQSGLLVPQIGTSQRKGFEFIQPLYWAINDQSDATFYAHHMQDRGEKIGAEYRYVLDEASRGTAMADGFTDSKIDNGSAETEQWGYPDDDLIRLNTDRYWFRMKHDQLLKYDISTKIDLDVVSDQDYLKEFRGGYTGFNDTDTYFTDLFGRGLDPIDETVRTNQVSFNKTGARYSLSADVRWNDNVVNRRSGTPDDTLQTLPRIAYAASKQSLMSTPYFFDATGGFVHFFRQTGAKGNRADIHPRIYYPMNWQNYLSFEPSIGTHATAWYMDTTDSTPLNANGYSRNIYDVKLDTASEIFRVFPRGGAGTDKIRHTAIPRVVYEYIPRQDQSDLPYFEATDRVAAKNIITYSITNQLTSRTPEKSRLDQPGQPGAPAYGYDQFFRFEVGQSYDIDRAGYGNPEPFLPIYGDLELKPGKQVALKADAKWSVYEDHFISHNIGLGLNNNRLDSLYTEYRFDRYRNESIFVNLKVNLTSKVKAYSLYERNIREESDIGTGLGVIYKSQCWSVDVSYLTTANDRRYTFMINLTGLGGMGTDVQGQALESPFTSASDRQ
jgi:LPS-assembly protein